MQLILGKSTFAKVLCGLEKRAKGRVIFDGKEWSAKKRQELCYMIMQDVNHQLFTDSVLEEVMLRSCFLMNRQVDSIYVT